MAVAVGILFAVQVCVGVGRGGTCAVEVCGGTRAVEVCIRNLIFNTTQMVVL